MKNLDLRFAVGTVAGPQSSVWKIWSYKDDVYAAHRSFAGIEKFSFHKSRQCRRAFTEQYARSSGIGDRATNRWERPPTPAPGVGVARCVLQIEVPTDYLSAVPTPLPAKPISWLPPGPAGSGTVFELFFTSETEAEVSRQFTVAGQRSLVAYQSLPSGEGFGIAAHHASFDPENLRFPARPGEVEDIIISPLDFYNSGRPLRVTCFLNPKGDDDPMICREWGAYKVRSNDPILAGLSFGTFTRDRLLAKSGGSL